MEGRARSDDDGVNSTRRRRRGGGGGGGGGGGVRRSASARVCLGLLTHSPARHAEGELPRCIGLSRDYYAVAVDAETTTREEDDEKLRTRGNEARKTSTSEEEGGGGGGRGHPSASISCVGYSEFYSAALARAMSHGNDGGGGGARDDEASPRAQGGGYIARGGAGGNGPRIFCKGLTMIPVARDKDRKADNVMATSSKGDDGMHGIDNSGGGGGGGGGGVVSTARGLVANLSRVAPVMMKETTRAGEKFARNASKVVSKMSVNAKQTAAFVYSSVGGALTGTTGRKPPT